MKPLAIAAVLAWGLSAQMPPYRVHYHCTDEDKDRFGLACSPEQPCPIFLELSGIDFASGRLFLSGNLHTSSTTLFSILLSTEDNGETWSERYAREPYATLDLIQFIDGETGWVSGQILQPTPKDAFLLLTNDGGKTWRRKPLFEDQRLGSIDQFWFDSKTTGALVFSRGNRHELYESQTGGESWNIKEVTSTLPKLKRPPVSPNWRIQPHAASRTFRIERRRDNKWDLFASFHIQITDCK